MAASTDKHFISLGLPPGACMDSVTLAYRKLARIHHPDKNDGSKAATEDFKVINTAYFALQCELQSEASDDNKHGGAHACTTDSNDRSKYDCQLQGCHITENRGSITIALDNKDLTQAWESSLNEMYGPPLDLGSKGLKFSSSLILDLGSATGVSDDNADEPIHGTVYVTLYASTNKMHIQGNMYILWLIEQFPVLCDRVSELSKKSTEVQTSANTSNKLPHESQPRAARPRTRRSSSDRRAAPDANPSELTSGHACVTSNNISALRQDILDAIHRLESHVVSTVEVQMQDAGEQSKAHFNDNVKYANEQIQVHQKLHQKAEKDCRELRKALEKANAEIADLKKLPGQSNATEQKLLLLTSSNKSLTESNLNLEITLKSTRNESIELLKQKQALLEEITILRSRVVDTESTITDLDSQLRSLRKSKFDLQSEINVVQSQLEAVWAEFGVAESYEFVKIKCPKSTKGDDPVVTDTMASKYVPTQMKGDNFNAPPHAKLPLDPNPFSALALDDSDVSGTPTHISSQPSPPSPSTPPQRQGGHVIVTDSLGRNLDPHRLLLGENPDRVFVKSMSGGRIEDANNFLKSGNFINTTVTILTGTNNIGKGESADICLTKYKEMVDTVLNTQPSAHINLLEIPPRFDNANLNSTISILNQRIRSLCDLNSRLHYYEVPIDQSDILDGLHLNRAGNHKLVTTIRFALIPGYNPPPPRSSSSPRSLQNREINNRNEQPHNRFNGNFRQPTWNSSPKLEPPHVAVPANPWQWQKTQADWIQSPPRQTPPQFAPQDNRKDPMLSQPFEKLLSQALIKFLSS
jgi:hypothetical protein